ncbi:unnamed protein product [Schistosoma margrebowiei]|uniref:Uncharacterized protein n=1 Tax=Schistosoma margrebowiei TaxID=48269 RepID=A0A183N0L4_9TREM|nr:unnamed protein product [Schistosoma margrebowiei]
MSDASNNNQEPGDILTDAEYPSYLLSNDEIFSKSDEDVSAESNSYDLISSAVDPHPAVSSCELSIQCGEICFK